MTTREQVYGALIALSAGLTWDSPARGFAYRSRRLQLWEDVAQKPALMQVEHSEVFTQARNLPSRRVFSAEWWVYHEAGASPDAIPATENNLILDAIEAAFPSEPDMAQTLNGLVHHCWIDGKIMKVAGDLDGQSMIVVPIAILVP